MALVQRVLESHADADEKTWNKVTLCLHLR